MINSSASKKLEDTKNQTLQSSNALPPEGTEEANSAALGTILMNTLPNYGQQTIGGDTISASGTKLKAGQENLEIDQTQTI